MSAYNYYGCATAFVDADGVQMIQPDSIPDKVELNDTAYVARLISIGVLWIDSAAQAPEDLGIENEGVGVSYISFNR